MKDCNKFAVECRVRPTRSGARRFVSRPLSVHNFTVGVTSGTSRPMPLRTASCSCGQLQARVTTEPLRVSICHCLASQRRTGSVFGAQARFAKEAVSITGTSKEFERTGDEKTKTTFRFCPNCGAPVYYTLSGIEGAVAIPVGAFAD